MNLENEKNLTLGNNPFGSKYGEYYRNDPVEKSKNITSVLILVEDIQLIMI